MLEIDGTAIANGIASSTSSTVEELLPLIILVGGTLLAILVVGALITFFKSR